MNRLTVEGKIRKYLNSNHTLNNIPQCLTQEQLIASIINPANQNPFEVESVNIVNDTKDINFEDGKLGYAALKDNLVANIILAGGLGSRVNQPKAFIQIPKYEITSLGVKLCNSVVSGLGKFFTPPTWILSNRQNRASIESQLDCYTFITKNNTTIVEQNEWVGCNPMFDVITENNEISYFPTGTGDLFEALSTNQKFLDWLTIGETEQYLFVSPVDDIHSNIDISLLGKHISSGAQLTYEVVRRTNSDCDEHVIAWVDGNKIALHPSELPGELKGSQFAYTCTNTCIINASVFKRLLGHMWNMRRVASNINNVVIFHLERELQELTQLVETQYIEVPRESRYFPIREPSDIIRLRDYLGEPTTTF